MSSKLVFGSLVSRHPRGCNVQRARGQPFLRKGSNLAIRHCRPSSFAGWVLCLIGTKSCCFRHWRRSFPFLALSPEKRRLLLTKRITLTIWFMQQCKKWLHFPSSPIIIEWYIDGDRLPTPRLREYAPGCKAYARHRRSPTSRVRGQTRRAAPDTGHTRAQSRRSKVVPRSSASPLHIGARLFSSQYRIRRVFP